MYWKMTVASVGVLMLLAVVCFADTDVETHMTHDRLQYGEKNFEDGHKAPLVMIIANTGVGGGAYGDDEGGGDRSERVASLGRTGGGRHRSRNQIRKTPMRLKRPVFSSKGPTSLQSRKRPKCHRRPRERLWGRVTKDGSGYATPGRPYRPIYSEYPRPGRPYGPIYIEYLWPGRPYGPIYSGYPRPGRPYGPIHIEYTRPGRPNGPIYSEYPRPGSPDEGQWPNNGPYPNPDRPQISPGTNYGNYSWQGRPDGGNGGNDGENGGNAEITEQDGSGGQYDQEREEQTEAMEGPDSTSGETTTELVTTTKRRRLSPDRNTNNKFRGSFRN